MKKIPMGNYVKVIVLFAATIILVLMLSNGYKEKLEYERANDDIMNSLSTVKLEELSNYLVENHDGFIYMAASSDASLDEFELDFKEYILEEELEKYFVYLDSSNYTNDDYSIIKKKYFSTDYVKNVNLGNYPNLFAVKDGEIVASLYTTSKNITLDDVRVFVNTYGVEQ